MKLLVWTFLSLICTSWAMIVDVPRWTQEITQVIVANVTIVEEPNPRQEIEYAQLQHRLQRASSIWNDNHPRHRLLSALHAYTRYKERNLAEVKRWRDLYKNLSKKQRSLVESTVGYTRKLNTVEHLFETNEKLALDIVRNGLEFYNIPRSELDEFIVESEREGKSPDRTSVVQGMKHFVRDWADEGQSERQEAFQCVSDSLKGLDRSDEKPLRVLLPGAGVGRLGFEIDALGGFEVTLNEWSAYVNLAYRYLAQLDTPNTMAYHPYIDWWSHHATTADMQRAVNFPDWVPPSLSRVVMVEGDFTTVFEKETGAYDVIVTLFFIDTARNLVSYLENIHRLLRPGGTWINLGPLLYGTGPFLQLSLDEIISLSERIGFLFEESEVKCGTASLPGVQGVEIAYGQNQRGLSRNAYQAQYWKATRR